MPIADDEVEDSGETFTLTLSNASAGVLIVDAEAIGTILNVEKPLTAELLEVPEQHGGERAIAGRILDIAAGKPPWPWIDSDKTGASLVWQ